MQQLTYDLVRNTLARNMQATKKVTNFTFYLVDEDEYVELEAFWFHNPWDDKDYTLVNTAELGAEDFMLLEGKQRAFEEPTDRAEIWIFSSSDIYKYERIRNPHALVFYYRDVYNKKKIFTIELND